MELIKVREHCIRESIIEKKGLVETTLDGKPQQWRLALRTEWFSLGTNVRTSKLDSWPFFHHLKKIKELNEWTPIIAHPLSDRTWEGQIDRLSDRGNDEDENPFIVRARKIPEIYADIQKGHEGKIYISYHTNSSMDRLTPGQSSWLHQKFDEQLAPVYSMNIIQFLKQQILDNNFAYIQKQLDEMEYSIQEYRDAIIRRREEYILGE